MINVHWVIANPEEATDKLNALIKALEPFAENPDSIDRPGGQERWCHAGVVPKEQCGRCSRAIAAWEALYE